MIIISVILFVLAVVVLMGKGDNLIAGYNTASEEERRRYNIVRLRRVIAGVNFLIAIMMLAYAFVVNETDETSLLLTTIVFPIVVVAICIIGIILTYTWAKHK